MKEDRERSPRFNDIPVKPQAAENGAEHQGPWELNSKFWEEWNKNTVSFYFSNFPNNWMRPDLWKVFARFGKVRDIFIAKKVNTKGRRFGFVRFVDVQNAEVLEVRLRNIQFGPEKLEVNISRFQKKVPTRSAINSASFGDQKYAHRWKLRGERSFADVCRGIPRAEIVKGKGATGQLMKLEERKWYGREFIVTNEEMNWLKSSYVAASRNVIQITQLYEKFCMEGFCDVKISPMGDGRVLVYADEDGALPDPESEENKWLFELFSSVQPWSQNLYGVNREVWVRLMGVPVHAWTPSFFSFLLRGLGSCLVIDEATLAKSRLDVARILVKTSLMGNIDKLIKVRINSQVFSIRIKEEQQWYDQVRSPLERGCDEVIGVGGSFVQENWRRNRSFSIPASQCDASGEEDDSSCMGSRALSLMEDFPERILEGRRERSLEFQGNPAEKETVASEKELVGRSGELTGNHFSSQKNLNGVNRVDSGLHEVGPRVNKSLEVVYGGCHIGPQSKLGTTQIDGLIDEQDMEDELEMPIKEINPEACGEVIGNDRMVNMSDEDLQAGDDKEKERHIITKKPRKIKRIAVAEEFWEDMESEGDKLPVKWKKEVRKKKKGGLRKSGKMKYRTSLQTVDSGVVGSQARKDIINSQVSDSAIRRRNRKLGVEGAREEAEQVWSLAKELGVESISKGGEMVNKLIQMEVRDRTQVVDQLPNIGNTEVEQVIGSKRQ